MCTCDPVVQRLLLVAIRNMVREVEGRPPSTAYIDGVLDERRKLAQVSRFSV
jgi:hypothetical protein